MHPSHALPYTLEERGVTVARKKEAISVASDGKPAILLGPWAIEKLHYLKQYCEIFSTGMKNIWKHRIFIDLFSGPGICVIENTGTEENGSPLIALNCKTPFTHYFFVDKNSDFIETLKNRTEAYHNIIDFINKDCNDAIDDIGRKLPDTNALVFTFIDPFNFEIEFNTLIKLTEKRLMDLLITFHISNLKRSIHIPSITMKRFFPPLDWDELYKECCGSYRIHERILLDKYEEGLKTIGYSYFDDCIFTHNIKHAPLYHLLFASKNKKGKEFFSKISMKSRTGQSRMLL